jgi:hypothetical protein
MLAQVVEMVRGMVDLCPDCAAALDPLGNGEVARTLAEEEPPPPAPETELEKVRRTIAEIKAEVSSGKMPPASASRVLARLAAREAELLSEGDSQ